MKAEIIKAMDNTGKLRLKNLYARNEENKGYKVYDELIIEYQENGNDMKYAGIVGEYKLGRMDALEAYDELAEDMVLSPAGAKNSKFFGANAGTTCPMILGFLMLYKKDVMFEANKKLVIETIDGQ